MVETNTLNALDSHTAPLTLLAWYRQYIYIFNLIFKDMFDV